jgi:hypothetical protein
MPVPLGKKERPTKLSMTELFPELCNEHPSYIQENAKYLIYKIGTKIF